MRLDPRKCTIMHHHAPSCTSYLFYFIYFSPQTPHVNITCIDTMLYICHCYCYILFTVCTSSSELFVRLLCEINQSSAIYIFVAFLQTAKPVLRGHLKNIPEEVSSQDRCHRTPFWDNAPVQRVSSHHSVPWTRVSLFTFSFCIILKVDPIEAVYL